MMSPQHTYILPLEQARETWDGEKAGENLYGMPACAESGLELIDGKLYSFEQTTGAGRRLQFYGDYSNFLRWRPLADVLNRTGHLLLGAVGFAALWLGYAGIVLPFLCIATFAMFVRSPTEVRRRLIPLVLVLPTLWVLMGLWGGLFYDSAELPEGDLPNPLWMSLPPTIGLVLLLSFAAIFIRRVAVGRAFAVTYSLLIGYFAVVLCVMTEVAINRGGEHLMAMFR